MRGGRAPTGFDPSRKIRNLDMFAGIGGFSLGLHRTGRFETVAFCEVEPYACRVLEKNFPGVPNIGDVTKAEFPEVDFITAGFPCQDISNAGQRAGITGTRSGLYGHVVRALRLVRPKGALLENVAALLGRGLDTVLGDLAEVRYDAKWDCIPAAAVGAPHIRDRIWILAHPQHPNANGPGPHRAPLNVVGSAEPGNQQVCVSGSLGQILADTSRELRDRRGQRAEQERRTELADCGAAMADADSAGLEGWAEAGNPGSIGSGREQFAERCPDSLGGYWAVEPNVGRVAHGVSSRVDRLRCLGNAVVPQVVEAIGRAILASLQTQQEAA